MRCVLLQLLTIGILMACTANSRGESPVEVYDRLLEKCIAADRWKELDNISGGIVWGTAYELDSLLDMFEATGDERYLERFTQIGDKVMNARADKTQTRDYRGRVTFGWPTGGKYTQGGPIVLMDRDGEESLQMETIGHAYNDTLAIEILEGPVSDSFAIRIVQTAGGANEPTLFDELTMATVAEKVNPAPGERGWLRVKALGANPPVPLGPFTISTGLLTMHGHHTGRIATALARFCALVKKHEFSPNLEAKGDEYLRDLRIVVAEHDQFVRENADMTRAWTIFEKGAPFWADGFVEPHNTLSASGSMYVHMHAATGDPYYLERATQFARLIRDHHELLGDDTWLFHYWWGSVETGFDESASISVNTPLWRGEKSPENISHLQLTLSFIADCHRHGIVFQDEDIERWLKTLKTKMTKSDDRGPWVSYYLTGEQGSARLREANNVLFGFTDLARCIGDAETVTLIGGIFADQFANSHGGVAMRGWSSIVLADRDLLGQP